MRYIPESHTHVICPDQKPYCVGGTSACAKLEVATEIFDASDIQDSHHIKLNKGCACQQTKGFCFIGDGNGKYCEEEEN